jgi:hypothetical protein
MPASETLKIVIQLRDEANRNIAKLNKSLKTTQVQATRTARAFKAFRGGLSRIKQSVFNVRTALLAAGAAFAAFAAGKRFLKAAQTQAKAVEGLNTALKAMGRFTPELSQNLQEVASAIQDVSNFGDEAVIEGTKFLATYRNITDELLPRTQRAMADLAALTGGDMVQAANLLGKASIGMVDTLRRVGISVDSNTFKAGGYVAVLAAIEEQVSGQAEAQRRATGSTIALGNAWGDVEEKLGEVLKIGIEPFVTVLVEEVQELNKYLQNLKKEGNLDEWARDISNAILDMVEVVVKAGALVGDAFRGWKFIWLGLKATFALLTDYLFRAMAEIADVIDDLRAKWRDWFGDVRKLGRVLQYAPDIATRSLGKYLVALEDGNVKLGETGDKLRDQAKFWFDVTNETADQIDLLAEQDLYYSRADKWLQGIRDRTIEYTKNIGKAVTETEKLAKPTAAPEASLQARLKSSLDRALSLIQTETQGFDRAFEEGKISLEKYYEERLRLTEAAALKEIAVLQQTADVEEDPSKRLALEDKVFTRKQKLLQDLDKLEQDKFKAEEELNQKRLDIDKTLSDLRLQLAQSGAGNIQERQRLELEALEESQAEQIQMLTDQKATEDQIEEAYRLHQIQRDQEVAKQREEINKLTIENIQSGLSQLSDAFGDAYAASGNTIKEFFYLQKAVAIAQAGIATYQNAIMAYQRGLEIPYVGVYLAPVFAAVAVAAGLARIAAIRNQSIAAGGTVEGHSPTDTADNIVANLTAGEFVQPVKTVRHYGAQAMEAIRRRLVPKELLQNYAAPKVLRGHQYYQAGGTVAPRAAASRTGVQGATAPEGQQGQAININNIIDPQMMDQYVATKPGQRNIMNVLSNNSFQLKQIVLGEG